MSTLLLLPYMMVMRPQFGCITEKMKEAKTITESSAAVAQFSLPSSIRPSIPLSLSQSGNYIDRKTARGISFSLICTRGCEKDAGTDDIESRESLFYSGKYEICG